MMPPSQNLDVYENHFTHFKCLIKNIFFEIFFMVFITFETLKN